MHGDELTGYVLMLRFIDDILNKYNVDSRITNLVNEIDIWINPLANPDGAYAGGNNNVWGATRSNANFIDLKHIIQFRYTYLTSHTVTDIQTQSILIKNSIST